MVTDDIIPKVLQAELAALTREMHQGFEGLREMIRAQRDERIRLEADVRSVIERVSKLEKFDSEITGADYGRRLAGLAEKVAGVRKDLAEKVAGVRKDLDDGSAAMQEFKGRVIGVAIGGSFVLSVLGGVIGFFAARAMG